jgi:hypothetical protein
LLTHYVSWVSLPLPNLLATRAAIALISHLRIAKAVSGVAEIDIETAFVISEYSFVILANPFVILANPFVISANPFVISEYSFVISAIAIAISGVAEIDIETAIAISAIALPHSRDRKTRLGIQTNYPTLCIFIYSQPVNKDSRW